MPLMSKLHWTAPPNWPAPPRGWTPPYGWEPDEAWGPPPDHWEFWQRRTSALAVSGAAVAGGLALVTVVAVIAAASSGDSSTVAESRAQLAAANQATLDRAAAERAAAETAAADQAAANQAAADQAAAQQAAAEKPAAVQTEKKLAAPVFLDNHAMNACGVFVANILDVATKQDRSNVARAINAYARRSSEPQIVDAGEMLTDNVNSWTGFMWDGSVSIFADVCTRGKYDERRRAEKDAASGVSQGEGDVSCVDAAETPEEYNLCYEGYDDAPVTSPEPEGAHTESPGPIISIQPVEPSYPPPPAPEDVPVEEPPVANEPVEEPPVANEPVDEPPVAEEELVEPSASEDGSG